MVARRILIVDDHRAVRSALRRVLEGQPEFLFCGEAENGQEAIVRASECAADAVILDISMPVMNGLDAAKVIKSVRPQTRILMFTSFEHPQLLQTALTAGADAILPKSASAAEVLIALRKLFERAA